MLNWPNSTFKTIATSIRPKNPAVAAKDSADDDLWGSIAAPAPRSASKPLNLKPATSIDDDDPWASIAAPAPTSRAKPLSAGRGRGAKPVAPKLGAQRINRSSSGMWMWMWMLHTERNKITVWKSSKSVDFFFLHLLVSMPDDATRNVFTIFYIIIWFVILFFYSYLFSLFLSFFLVSNKQLSIRYK